MNRAKGAILVVGPSWVGDMVLAQSLFKALKTAEPDCEIDVLAPAWSRPLTARMPEVRASIDAPFGHGAWQFSARRRMGHELRGRYERAIVLPNSWKSALVPYFADIPQRTGYHGEQRYVLLNDRRHLDKRALPMTVQRFLALADPHGHALDQTRGIPIPRLQVDAAAVSQTLSTLGLSRPDAPVIALCPGAAYGPSKRWPAAYYGELAQRKFADGWYVWLIGAGEDAQVCAEINMLCGGECTDLSGRTDLDQAIDLLSLTSYVVSNDSGLMHVAAALDRPLVAIFGSTSPRHTPPLGTSARVVWKELSCSPCFARDCPLGHGNCLKQISVDQVIAQMVIAQ